MWSVFFSVSSAVACACCLIATIYVARSAARERGSLLARLRSQESATESMRSSIEQWGELTTDLANSVKMQKVRRSTRVPSSSDPATGLPDPHADPEGWRKAMNLRIAERRIAGGK